MYKRDGKWYTPSGDEIIDPTVIAALEQQITDGIRYPDGKFAVSEAREADPPAPDGETKAQTFKRLAKPRMNAVLDKMRILGNLASKSNYEWTSEQWVKMREAIIQQLAVLDRKFEGRPEKKEFDFDGE